MPGGKIGRAIAASVFAFVIAGFTCAQAVAQSSNIWSRLNGLAPEELQKVLVAEATKEGKLTWYGSVALDRAEVFIKLFNQKYPGIKVDFVFLSEPQVPERVRIEHAAHRSSVDVVLTQSTFLDIIKPYLAAYQPTQWDNFDPRFRFGSLAEGWTALAFEVLIETIAWRSDRISAAEAPKTLDDVANPKWKGRVGTTILLERFIDSMVGMYGEAEAMRKLKALAALDNRMYRNYAALANGLVLGEVDLTWEFLSHRTARLKAERAPIDFNYQEGPALGLPNTIAAVKEAPHPHAAALFMEFASRPEVLEAMDKAEGGRVFGNMKGKYTVDVSRIQGLTMYRPMSEADFKKYNALVQELFVRK
jgi:iron(III) transport system substrate-binding protein